MLAPGLRIDDYVIDRRVATGATSDVYAGHHVASGEPVAVKVLGSRQCLHAELVARFLNEAQTLQELRHPRLVRALAFGVLPEGRPFMILEWMPIDLQQALQRAGGSLPSQRCAQVIRQLVEALDVLHTHGLVHRDLKPANVLLSHEEPEAWDLKLADLGLAKRLVDISPLPSVIPVSTAGNALLGTWDYMAPEQWLHSKSVDSQADVYALGVLWFQMLAGRLPFVAKEQNDLLSQHVLLDPPLQLLSDLAPGPTQAMVARMLAKKPSHRPTLRDIQELLSSEEG